MSNHNGDVCQICGGMGLVSADVPVGHPNFGKAFPCVCQADKLKVRQAERLRKMGNFEAYVNKTFATFEIDYARLNDDEQDTEQYFALISEGRKRSLTDEQLAQVNAAAEQALHYAQTPEGWLLLRGSYGTGKTHLAAAIANWRIERAEPVLFVTVPDLLDHLRATYGPSSEVAYDAHFEEVRNAPLLILDDLGAENQTAWALEKLYQLLSHRHALRLPTIITTNASPDTLDPRIRSRLLDQSLTTIVPLDVPDHRSPVMTWQEMDLTNLERYRDMMFESFDLRENEGLPAAQVKRLAQVHSAAQSFAERPAGWLVLTGEPGCGKTHLAAAIAHERKSQGEAIQFVTTSELLDHLRTTFYPGSTVRYDKRLIELKETPLLVLDDLNIDKSLSSWARDKLYDILLYRFDANLPTIITTRQPLDEMDARLKSRVINQDRSIVEAITVPSYPGKAALRRAVPPRKGRVTS